MKKFGNLMYAVCLILLVVIMVVIRPLTNLDEIWNFNIARCISNGLVPYKDISMVSTPLLGFLMAIPLRIFGQELFYTRVFAIVMVLLSFLLIFKIFKNLDIKIEITRCAGIGILALLCNYIIPEYNLLSLLILLAIELIEIKMLKDEKYGKSAFNIALGILAGLMICTKQTVGLIISFIVLAMPFIYIESKLGIKNAIKRAGLRLLGILIPSIAFVIYLNINGAWSEFINYSIFGIKTFTNSISYVELFNKSNVVYKVLLILMPSIIIISVVTNTILKFKKRHENELYTITMYAAGMFSIVFPIADKAHFGIAIIPSIILLIYCMKSLIDVNKFARKIDYKYVLEFVNVCSVLFILITTLCIEYLHNDDLGVISKHAYQNHFRYIYIPESVNSSINTINEFASVKSKKVYILDASAAIYMIPADRYNKDYDMLNIGNLGTDGESKIIQKIKDEDALYLILRDDEALNWQNPNQVRAYIKENMEFVGTKDRFDIYQNRAETIEGSVIEESNENKTE